MRSPLSHLQPETRVPSVPGPREVVTLAQPVRVTWTLRESLGGLLWAALGELPRRAVNDTQLLFWVADWLVLQGPAMPVFEGDPLVLRCQAWQGWPLTQVTFYRDGSPLGPPGPHWEFSIAAVREADSGQYHCSAAFRSLGPGNPETAASVAITVQGECRRQVGWQRQGGGGRAGRGGRVGGE